MKVYRDVINRGVDKKPLIGRISGRQSVEIDVKFPKAFSQIPHVQISVERIDTGGFIEPAPFKQNDERIYQTVTRYDVSACNISEVGFTIKVATWEGSVIYGFRIGWLAMGEQKEKESLSIKELLRACAEHSPRDQPEP